MSGLTQEEASTPTLEYLAEYIGDRLLITSYVFFVLISVIYALFLISRALCTERNYWETWTIYPISYVLCLGVCICSVLFVKIADGGRHAAYVLATNPRKMERMLQLQTAVEFIYMAGVTFPKVAILMLYLRIFTERKVRIITKVVMAVVVIHWIASGLITGLTICQPFAYKWDKSIKNGHCSDVMAAWRYISIPNILTDIAILVLPMPTLYHLQLSRTRKLGVFMTFLAGGLGIITSVTRFIEFYEVDLDSDITYLGINAEIYTLAEMCAYFICSCLPGLRPLGRKVYHSVSFNSVISRYYHRSDSTSDRVYRVSSLGNLDTRGRHTASISAGRGKLKPQSIDDDTAGFIRLEETFHVDHLSTRTLRGEHDAV